MADDIMIENMTDVPPVNRYLGAIAVCNSLALLASQGTLNVYLQRMRILKRIQKIWTKGDSLEIALTSAADVDTDSDSELQPDGSTKTRNLHRDLESVKIELNDGGVLADGCLLEPVKEDVKNTILEEIKEVKEESNQMNNGGLRSDGSRLQRFKSKSKTKRKKNANAEKSATFTNASRGRKNQLVSETLSIGSAGQGTFNSVQQMLANSPKDVIRCDGDCLDNSIKHNKHKKRDNDCELVCSVCKKKFSMKYELRQHQMIHSGERPYMCSICGKRFRIRSVLTGHMKIHLGDKRHSCSQCGKSFVQASGLKDHMAVHSKIRAHICNVCGKDFIRITMLNYHMRSHTGEKPYVCSVCEKRFALSRQLNTHLRIHSNEWRYSCDVCSKKFKFKGGLNRHKRLHQDMKPFSCSVCPKVFTQAGNLRVHMRTHTGEKPYVCSNCGQKFSHQPTLKKHKESCH